MAVVTGVALAAVGWAAWRQWEDGRWDNRAIAAQFRDVTVQRQNEKDVHLLLHYALTNATHRSYRLAGPPLGVLMQRVRQGELKEGELKEMDSVIWDPIAIPAGKTVNAEFDVTLLSVENLTNPEAIHSVQKSGSCSGPMTPRDGAVGDAGMEPSGASGCADAA